RCSGSECSKRNLGCPQFAFSAGRPEKYRKGTIAIAWCCGEEIQVEQPKSGKQKESAAICGRIGGLETKPNDACTPNYILRSSARLPARSITATPPLDTSWERDRRDRRYSGTESSSARPAEETMFW